MNESSAPISPDQEHTHVFEAQQLNAAGEIRDVQASTQ